MTHQTAAEGALINVPVTVCRTARDLRPGINITNYDMLPHFSPDAFAGLVVDESSCMKAYEGSRRQEIRDFAASLDFRLACTATPAPNELIELGTHSEFLGIMNIKEMAALFFRQDKQNVHDWQLKPHAREAFYTWLASWAVAMRMPSDLGFPDDDFRLLPLHIWPVVVECDQPADGQLFAVEARSLEEVRAAMRASLPDRVRATAEMVNADREPWLVWCWLNAESEALAKAIPDAVEIRGSDSIEHKEQALLDFAAGRVRVLVSKASICGWGMNFQHCARVAFVGLSYSWESWYQAIRRCWRFGQKRAVNCYVVTSQNEGRVVEVIRAKEKQAEEMMDELVGHMRELQMGAAGRDEASYRYGFARGTGWEMHLGDSVELVDQLDTESVGLVLYSPPFPTFYAYSNSIRDMGNTRGVEEMIEQYRFLIAKDKLLRVLMPGRVCAVHLQQAMAFKWQDGFVGIRDFRGALI